MKSHNLIRSNFDFKKRKYLLLLLLCIFIIIIRLWYTGNIGMDVLSTVQSSVSVEVLFMILSPFCLWLNQVLYFQNREFAVVRVKNKYNLWKVNATVIFWNAFLIAIMNSILSFGSSMLNREIAISAQMLQLYIYSFILFLLGLILIGILQNILIVLTENKAIAFFLVFLVFLFDISTIKLQKVSNLFVVNDRDLIDLYSFAGRVLCLISVLIVLFWINWFLMEKKDMFRTSKKKVR
ncbi:hypothetical protein C1909_11185 [Listeria ivanovii]|uniref:Uncharacterized protein n=1 Tax=Listeria ivanovii (strain ATCC BAA-678 / PAM 55) TaxID=881621 RepID=G2Z8J5_LISIP|nr:hypothetical protein [Listeria ivanovii]MBK3914947.1 hypothetical protein [Listeria ivanovii subsp. ivanovii]MBK3921892.1 hypothetical protein [Listeria ivanovii subsp. ivanovii]MBK3927235.1 hypothetical protein [Listeria ivanovii subsp. ivanovii]MCJ1717792.1 hypothetical protein [Listeria ivanovii]MCJ1722991.1 hypothetical protein [Listeria ivanovii]